MLTCRRLPPASLPEGTSHDSLGDRMRRLGRDANQRWLAFFIPGIVLVVVAMPINGLARLLITAVAIVFLLMAVIVGGRQRGT